MNVHEESWGDWAGRQLQNPGSGVRQLMAHGLSRDTAFLVIMLGRLHAEVLDIEAALEVPPEDWKDG